MFYLLSGFTGIDQPYEKPENPELTVHAGKSTVDECVQQVIELLQERVSIE